MESVKNKTAHATGSGSSTGYRGTRNISKSDRGPDTVARAEEDLQLPRVARGTAMPRQLLSKMAREYMKKTNQKQP